MKSTSNDFGTLRWGYAVGRLTERRLSNGKRTTYGYDNLGRVTLVNHDADNPTLVGQDYQYVYDNGDGAITCGVTGTGGCAYRKGRLAIVKIEYAPAVFWNLEYDYRADTQVSGELWPGSRQTTYEYDAAGRVLRVVYPVQTGDRLRFEYNATANDGEDQSEVSRVVHEINPGTDYLVWARKMVHDARGQVLSAYTADREDAAATPSVSAAFNTDGTISTWAARRRNGAADVNLLSRTYQHWPDGAPKGWSSTVGTDPGRTFFYDGAQRLTCSAGVSGAASCPGVGNNNLLESYSFDVNENRLTKATSGGTTTYSTPLPNQLYDEYPPGQTIWYGYDVNTFGGRTYDVHQSTAASNQRNYYYYASGQLRSIAMPRPGATQGTYENHEFTFLYDHGGRPIYVADRNLVSAKERRENLYWAGNQLLERVVTPDSTAATTYTVDMFAPVGAAATGWLQLQYVSGTFSSETRRYIARDPAGLVGAVWAFTGTGASSTAYTADYQAFGALRTSSGTANPGLGFHGQLTIVGSDARVWNGATTLMLREPLMLNRWRVFDPRVGRFLTAEPVILDRGGALGPRVGRSLTADPLLGEPGTSLHPFTYAYSNPLLFGDPSGGEPILRIPLPGGRRFEVPGPPSLFEACQAFCLETNSGLTERMCICMARYCGGVAWPFCDCGSHPTWTRFCSPCP